MGMYVCMYVPFGAECTLTPFHCPLTVVWPPCSVPVSIAECVDDMVAYSKLNDSVVQLIKLSPDPSLKEAQDLIARLERRQLYKHIGQTAPIDTQHHSYLKVGLAAIVTSVCVCVGVCLCLSIRKPSSFP